jgi:hypothetical protein
MLMLLAMLGCGQDTTVVVMNNGDLIWEGMTVLVDGSPACKADLAPGQTVTATAAGCELSEVGDAEMAPDEPEEEEVDDAGEEGGSTPEKADEPKKDQKLAMTATVSGGVGPARRIGVTNKTGFRWHNCSVTLNGKYTYRTIPDLDAGEYEGIMGQKFKSSGGDVMTKNHQIKTVSVACNEGTGSASPQ